MVHSSFARRPTAYLSAVDLLGWTFTMLPLVGPLLGDLSESSTPMLNENAQSADFNGERMELSEADK